MHQQLVARPRAASTVAIRIAELVCPARSRKPPDVSVTHVVAVDSVAVGDSSRGVEQRGGGMVVVVRSRAG